MKNQSLKSIPPIKSNIASPNLESSCQNETAPSESAIGTISQLIPTARKRPGDRKSRKKEKSQNMEVANISPTKPSNTVLKCPICNITMGSFSFRLLSLHLRILHKNEKSEKININGASIFSIISIKNI